MVDEAIEPKDFIMGDWPSAELAKRGFQRGTPNGDIYTKVIGNNLVIQVVMLREHDGAFNGTRSEIVVYTDAGGGHYVNWSGIVAHKYVGLMVDELDRIASMGYKTYTGFAPLMREFWNKLPKDQPEAQQDPKKYIMSTTWVTDELKAMGYQMLHNDSYWLKRFTVGRSKKTGNIVVWFDRLNAAHLSLEILKGTRSLELWKSYVALTYVAQVAKAMEEAFRLMSYRYATNVEYTTPDERDHTAEAVTNALKHSLGADYQKPFHFNEASDPKQFIMSQGPFWAFKARFEELRWHYEGVNSVPTTYGNTVDEHQFTKVRDSYHYGSDVSPCSYKAWVSEFVQDGVSLLQTYGGGAKQMASEDARGEQVTVPVEWDIDEIIQLSNMSAVDYAEWVDDEFMANTGPDEAPEPEEHVPEPEDDL